jgi:fatty-acyl-CoA synthase
MLAAVLVLTPSRLQRILTEPPTQFRGSHGATARGMNHTLSEEPRPHGLTLASVLEEVADRRPAHPAILYRDETISYGELRDAARSIASSLLALGVRRGDRVGALLSNQPEWVMMAMGAAYVGAVFVPFNTWYKRNEIGWLLRHCGVCCFVVADRFLKQDYTLVLRELLPELRQCIPGGLAAREFPSLRSLVVLGQSMAGAFTWEEFLSVGARQSRREVSEARAAVIPDDPAFILYTSGSTADPKGVLLAHGGIIANGWDMGTRRGVTADDRVWLGSPLFYGLGAANALPVTLTRGATLVLQGAFDAGTAIGVIERTRSTVYYGTGNMSRAILDHPDYERRRIATLQKGNAGTMTEYKRLTLVEMGIAQACAAYGLTESYGNATVSEVDDPLDVKLSTSGRPLPGIEVTIVDPQSGRPLGCGEIGLILLRGHTTPGYYNNDEENRRAFRGDGSFDTGDLGSLDPQGRLRFHARLKEVIKSGGINVSPMEVEQLLVQHPHIRDAHVVGIPHATRGQIVVAFVDADVALPEEEVRDFIRDRAASFKVPHRILFRDAAQLPRLASGKVAKLRLAEEASEEINTEPSDLP